MQNEKWYTIPKFPKYEVNERLQVRHKQNLKIKSCYMDKGYLKLNVQGVGGKKHKPYLHQVSGWVFVPNPENKPELHHIDEDKLNNHPSNLMWVTKKEHREISRLNEQISFKICRKDVVYIRDNYSEEKKHDLAIQFGVRPTTIYNIAIGAARADIKEGKISEPVGQFKKIINIDTGEIYPSAEKLSTIIGVKKSEINRQLNGERYCHIPYRYVGGENKVRLKPTKEIRTKLVAKFDSDNGYIETIDLLKTNDQIFNQRVGAFLNGNSSNVGGFYYKKVASDGSFIEPQKFVSQKKIIIRGPVTPSKGLLMFDINGNKLQEFPSIGLAAAFIKTEKKNFRKQINRSSTGFHKGYIWKYA